MDRIEMYLNGKPLGFTPFKSNDKASHTTRLEQALAYAHTLCKLEGHGSHYTYSRINGRETIRIFTSEPRERVFTPSRVIGKC